MSTAHTPAPWDIEVSSYGHEIWLGGDGAGMIIINGWINGGCMDNPARWAVVQADARLIAAAPDLLAACQALLSQIEWGGAPDGPATQNARAAIALATGEETDA